MARTRNLNIVITGDASSAKRAFTQVDSAASKTETRMQKATKAFNVLGAAASGALLVGLKKSTDAAIESEKAQAQLEAQLKASGISYQQHAKQIELVIQKTSQLAAVDDEELTAAFTNLVRSTGNVNQSLKLLTLTADLSRAKHIDLERAAQLVGRVANGNVTALSRYGVTIDKNASAQEALAAAQRKFSGQAAAYGRTTSGSLDRIGVATENLQEAVGSALLPTVERLSNGLANLIRWLQRNRTATTAMIGAVGTLAAAWIAYRTAALAAAAATTIATGGLNLIVPAVVALAAALAVAYSRSRTFRTVVNDAFEVVKTGARGVGRAVDSGVVTPFRKIVRVAQDVVAAVKDVVNWLKRIPRVDIPSIDLNPFGDGVGVPPMPTGGGPVNLMGARPALAPLAAIGASAGLRVSSGKRPGSITSTGNTSWHSSGEAIDLAGPPAGMMRTFQALRSGFGSRLAELIYTPGGVGIKNGRPFRYGGQVAADHFDHVHVAMDVGRPGIGDGIGEAARAAKAAGFTGQDLITAVAVAGPESGYRNAARLVTSEEDSRSMWQINTLAHPWAKQLNLQNSTIAARAARRVWREAGGSWGPWTGFTSGAYRGFLDRARDAVRGVSSRSDGSPGSRRSSTPPGAAGPATSRSEARRAAADLRVAEAQATPGARDDVKALQQQERAVTGRIKSIRRKLSRRGLSRGTRTRLQQELTGLVGERAGIQSSIKEARTSLLPAQSTETGSTDSGGDVGAGDDALTRAIEENTRAQQEHTQALQGVQSELKRQTDLATQIQITENFQIKKYLADLLSGQIAGSGVVRGYTPGGSGVSYAY